jgi:hypothetical protein
LKTAGGNIKAVDEDPEDGVVGLCEGSDDVGIGD